MADAIRIFFTIVLIIQLCTCTIGYFGNIITCIVIASNKSMYTTTNVYLFNLAIADFIMLTVGLTEFTVLIWYTSKGDFHDFEDCVIRNSILNTSFNVSIMTMTAFTIERYLAICHPFLARRILSISKALKLIFVIWIIGLVYGYFIGYQFTIAHIPSTLKTIVACSWNDALPHILNVQSLVLFILPFMLLTVLYILIWQKLVESCKIQKNQGANKNIERSSEIQSHDDSSNRKIFKMLVTVVSVFFISWAPYHIGRFFEFNLTHKFFASAIDNDSNYYLVVFSLIMNGIYTTAYFISASANPIIYNALCNKFRDAFKEVLIKCWYNCRCKKVRKTEVKQGAII